MKNKRSYSNIILTKDFYGLIYAFKKNLKNSVTVLLDSDFDTSFYLSSLNVKSLSRFLDEYEVDLDLYIEPINTMAKLDSKLIFLSDSPFLNLYEMYRKFEIDTSELSSLEPERFNDCFESLIDEVSNSEIHGSDLKEQIYAILRRNYYVYDAIRPLLSIVKEDKVESYLFNYYIQTLHSTSFASELDEAQTIYFVISALSRSYKVSSAKLINELCFKLKSLDKGLITTKNVELFSDKILLDGEYGLLSFQKLMHFYMDKSLSFKSLDFDIYNSCSFVSSLKVKGLEHFKNTRLIDIKSRSLGGDFPHNEVFIDDKMQIKSLFYYKKLEADKESFYADIAIEKAYIFLRDLFIDIDEDKFIKSVKEEGTSSKLYRSTSKSIKTQYANSIVDSNDSILRKYSYLGAASSHYMGQSSYNKSLF